METGTRLCSYGGMKLTLLAWSKGGGKERCKRRHARSPHVLVPDRLSESVRTLAGRWAGEANTV